MRARACAGVSPRQSASAAMRASITWEGEAAVKWRITLREFAYVLLGLKRPLKNGLFGIVEC